MMSIKSFSGAGILAAAALFCSVAFSAGATEADKDHARKEMDTLYQQLLSNPSDKTLTMRYATMAMQAEDYEAAIPPLERILMSEPDNAKVKLNLGVMYHALGSYTMAKSYFTDAKQTKSAPADVVSQADDWLKRL